jgi:hypothetical protein
LLKNFRESAGDLRRRKSASPSGSATPTQGEASADYLTGKRFRGGLSIAVSHDTGNQGVKNQRGGCYATDRGSRVRFRLSDVFLPSPEALSQRPSTDPETEGEIVGFSDSGPRHHAFAVVELEDGQSIVVPVEKLKLARPKS